VITNDVSNYINVLESLTSFVITLYIKRVKLILTAFDSGMVSQYMDVVLILFIFWSSDYICSALDAVSV
jgi:hypothetical protein